MRIFNKGEGWDEKVNFVDNNNVLVGYDMEQNCCEYADWFISDKEENDIKENNGIVEGLEDYCFDTKYFIEVNPDSKKEHYVFDKGGMVRFKLISDGKKDLFLHLYNCHNGYYGHGFEAEINGVKWQKGWL